MTMDAILDISLCVGFESISALRRWAPGPGVVIAI